MSSIKTLMKVAEALVKAKKAFDKGLETCAPKDLVDIVKFHGLGAAASSAAVGLIPGAGGVAATACYAGFVWTMYGRLGKKLEIPFSRNILKSLASGVLTNIAAYVATSLVATSVISLFPGIGSFAASAIDAGLGYAVVTASGIIYMKILTKMFQSKVDPTSVSFEELTKIAKETTDSTDMKELLKEIKNEYKTAKDEKIEIDESDSEEYLEESEKE